MSIERKQIGETLKYRGHEIIAKFLGPDLLCYVDGRELSPFYENLNAVHKAGMQYVDQIEDEHGN